MAPFRISLHAFPPFPDDQPFPAIAYLKGFLDRHGKKLSVRNVYWNQLLSGFFHDRVSQPETALDPDGMRRLVDALFAQLCARWGGPALAPESLDFCRTVASLGVGDFSKRRADAAVDDLAEQIEQRFHAQKLAKDAVVGCSSAYAQTIPALALFHLVRRKNPDATTVIGGLLQTEAEALVRAFDCVDVAVYGPGEETLLEIVQRRQQGLPLATIPGTVVRHRGRARVFPPRARTIPHEDAFASLAGFDYARTERKCVPVWDSRGCGWGRCTFCDDTRISGKAEGRSVDGIVREIAGHLRDHPDLASAPSVDVEFLGDEVGGFSKKRLIELAHALKGLAARHPNLNFFMELSPAYQDDETFRHLGQLDLTLEIGFEHWSHDALALLKKPHQVEQAMQTLKLLERYPRVKLLSFNYLTGFPGETHEHLHQSFAALFRLRYILGELLAKRSIVWLQNDRWEVRTLGLSKTSPLGRAWDWTQPLWREKLGNAPATRILGGLANDPNVGLAFGEGDTRGNQVFDLTQTIAPSRTLMKTLLHWIRGCRLEAFFNPDDRLVLRDMHDNHCRAEYEMTDACPVRILHLTRAPVSRASLLKRLEDFGTTAATDYLDMLDEEGFLFTNPRTGKIINTLPSFVQQQVDIATEKVLH